MGTSPSAIQPEFLNPDADFTPPPEPERRPRPSWSYAPATYVLVGINFLVFLVMAARGVSLWNPTSDQLMFWGADNAGAVLIHGQWWRIVTAMFVHVGILHLATNMWCLWNLGLLAEPLMGSAGVVAVYILTGAAGNLLSTFRNWWRFYPGFVELTKKIHGTLPTKLLQDNYPAGAGASGAVFGIAGALIILLGSHLLPVPPIELRKLRKSVIYFAAINLGIGLTISLGVVERHTGVSIDNSAHVGGVLCGLLFAAPMVPRIGSEQSLFAQRLRVAVGMVIGILVLFGFFVAQQPR